MNDFYRALVALEGKIWFWVLFILNNWLNKVLIVLAWPYPFTLWKLFLLKCPLALKWAISTDIATIQNNQDDYRFAKSTLDQQVFTVKLTAVLVCLTLLWLPFVIKSKLTRLISCIKEKNNLNCWPGSQLLPSLGITLMFLCTE